MKHLWKVLIAIAMAVMLALVVIPATATPATAEGTEVTLTTEVRNPCFKVAILPIGGTLITEPPYLADFGTVIPGTNSSGVGLRLTYGGRGCLPAPPPVIVTASVTGDLYKTCLQISGDGTNWVKVDGWTATLTGVNGFSLRVTVPLCYAADTHNGTITFVVLGDLPIPVSLTTTVEKTICFDFTPTSLDFGTIYRGKCNELPDALTITNCGNVRITVTAIATGSPFAEGLTIDGTSVISWTIDLTACEEEVISLELCVPAGAATGIKTGTLKFIVVAAEE